MFEMNGTADTPQTYILIERWTDQEAVQAHLNADHLAALMRKIRQCVPETFSAMRLIHRETSPQGGQKRN